MIVVLMGVAGSGKTTVGEALAARLGWSYFDADDFHPPANVEKMRAGIPLGDADRWPWLDRLNALLHEQARAGRDAVLACSALRQVYRERIERGGVDVRWVHLEGSATLIEQRMQARQGHYMPASLLRSQFAILEKPPAALNMDIDRPPQAIVSDIIAGLGLSERDTNRREA
ncbi:MAG: gluconokinase [Burkholderiales bacterium]|nr:gluconokinase [Burkholderiales bacterium]